MKIHRYECSQCGANLHIYGEVKHFPEDKLNEITEREISWCPLCEGELKYKQTLDALTGEVKNATV